MEDINKQEALEYIISAMIKGEEFKGVEKSDIDLFTKEAMAADFAYMKEADVESGGVYDEDDAYDYIMEKLCFGKDDETMALASLIVDSYLEYFNEYLEENNLIDWE